MRRSETKFINQSNNQIFYITRDEFNSWSYIAEVVKPDGFSSKLRMNQEERDSFVNKLMDSGWKAV